MEQVYGSEVVDQVLVQLGREPERERADHRRRFEQFFASAPYTMTEAAG